MRPYFRVLRQAISASAILSVVVLVGSVSAVAMAAGGDRPPFSWQLIDTGSADTFVHLDAQSADTVWVAGTTKLLRSIDGGNTFTNQTPPDLHGGYITDLEAWGPDRVLVTIRTEHDNYVFRATDGGSTWTETMLPSTSPDLSSVCTAMFDRRRGFIVGTKYLASEARDPIRFHIYLTNDGGRSWTEAPDEGTPPAIEGESLEGDCATTTGRKGFFSTGSIWPDVDSRVIRTSDFGLSWEVASTPIDQSISAMDFRTNRLGIAIETGGAEDRNIARTTDGGKTWVQVDPADGPAAIPKDVAWWSDLRGDQRALIPDAQRTVFTVGLSGTGSDVSLDRGKTWQPITDSVYFHTVDCAARTLSCWAAGDSGKIARLVIG